MPDDPASSATARQFARKLAEDHYYAALDLVLEGHHEQAVEEYREAVAADPKFTDALHGLSRALQDLNRFDEAIEVAQQISDIDPDDILAHTSLSILYQKKGMVPEAEAEGNKAGAGVEAAVEEEEWVRGWSLPRACVGQRGFFCAFWVIRAFTIFFTRAAGRGLSTGKWMVPLVVSYPLSSFLKALITDAVGNKLQWFENAANHTSVPLYLKAGIP